MASMTRVASLADVTSDHVFITYIRPDGVHTHTTERTKTAVLVTVPMLLRPQATITGIHEYRE